MTQFQTNKTDINSFRIVDLDEGAKTPSEGEILVRIDKFGFSANNVTYAVAGDTLGYWEFFRPSGSDTEGWGVLPVWGFADVVSSHDAEISVGERLFGYFPPASHLVMRPGDVSKGQFVDTAPHRAELPVGYNVYRRVSADPAYDPAGDDMHMLFFPLYATSFALWDVLKEHDWYDAEQVIIISASSKTSIGLAYAIHGDDTKPACIGLTSGKNQQFVSDLGIYDQSVTYDALEQNIRNAPSAIVDMSGNAEVLGRLHATLGDHMMKTLSVGLTHWDTARRDDKVIKDRTEFFFAPSQIQKRIKEWGPAEFGKRSGTFINDAVSKSSNWLNLRTIDGISGMNEIYSDMVYGKADPRDGFAIKV